MGCDGVQDAAATAGSGGDVQNRHAAQDGHADQTEG